MRKALLQLNRIGYCISMKQKALIIRFSSFGDIIQSLACVPDLAQDYDIHFLTKSQFAALPSLHPDITKVISFDKSLGLLGLVKLALKLRKNNYHFIYDAHENPRSKIVRMVVSFFTSTKVHVRHKERIKRFLFFKLKRRSILPTPYKGMFSYCEPVNVKPRSQRFKFEHQISEDRRQFLDQFKNRICLVPSAAWEMKRWPLAHWKSLIKSLNGPMLILGGPEDTFCSELAAVSDHCENLAGTLSLVESCYIISISKVIVSADTGLLHVADIQEIAAIALIGPTAFGYPSFESSVVMENTLDCKPCSKDGRGKCVQSTWQKCMVDISPSQVKQKIIQLID